MLAVWIGCAFALGSLVRLVGLPPLVGFLAAGFILSAFGIESSSALEEISHLGVLLLLFTVGLKLRLRNLLQPEVWGTAIIHLVVSIVLFGVAINAVADLPPAAVITLAAALGFSSTVLAAKVLEGKRELRAFHGRVAIGILIVQDLFAVALLAVNGDHSLSPWAFLLLGLPLIRPIVGWLLDASGHQELLVLYGALLAVAVGGYGFELVGLSPELGALVLGTMLSDHVRANELGDSLWSIKEFFLVGFFLSIGLSGMPSLETFGLALLLALAIPVKAALFFVLLLGFGLRARTGFLAGLSLASYSEFGLIVTKLAVNNGVLGNEWLILIALVVALSFVFTAPINFLAHPIWERSKHVLRRMQRDCPHPDDQPISLGEADTVIVGMGRVGTGAYDYMCEEAGRRVVGVDS
ncbi:MAG: cation:proton antiporter, partial [Gammaproteobacteria bacterium]|nr:cation:proton antiporter [Gammaproteobacteria bacterium]